jgi:effector-binding domain-containing protein
MKKNNFFLYVFFIATVCLAYACNNAQQEKKVSADSPVTKKETPKAKKPLVETKRGPVINITDTLSIKRIVLTIKDSAATMDRVGLKLGQIYGVKLAAIIKKNNLKVTGAPVAWYKGAKVPVFFEAGLPIDKKPSKLPKGVYIKEIGIDSIVVAHFYGPYDLIPQAYEALGDWLKGHKKIVKGTPYEIYVDSPVDEAGKPKDPYKVQTDIVFAWK